MPVIAVVNRKGGSGKSTLSTNIAAWCAQSGWQVMLGDIDRQQSVRSWLQRRPGVAPPITTWAVDNGKVFRAPRGTTHVVLDTPGALYDYEQSKLLVWLDAIVVPIGPSLFDREASLTFLSELRRHPRVSSGKCKIAVIGMRWPQEALNRWKRGEGTWEHSLLTVIPDDPRYSGFLENGSSVFDEYSPMTPQDMVHWSPLLQWLENVWTAVRPPAEQSVTSPRQTTSALRKIPAKVEALAGCRAQRLGEKPTTSSGAAAGQCTAEPPPVTEDFIPAYLRKSVGIGADLAAAPHRAIMSEVAALSARSSTLSTPASKTVVGSGSSPICTDMAEEPATAWVHTADIAPPPQKDKGWLSRWLKLA